MMSLAKGSFWHWRGYVIIKIKGLYLELFVNQAIQSGVMLRDVERLSEQIMVAKVSVSGFRRLRVLCRGGKWQLSIVKKVGLPFLFFRMARRKGLLAGGVVALLLIYLLSSVVWFVEVQGCEQVPRQRILELAAQFGLRSGALKSAFSGKVVERQLLLTLDRLSWAYVETRGTLAIIHVAEKVVPDPELTMPGDIVAAFDGVIEDLLVLRGVPLVKEGDIVRVSQVVISGLIPPNAPLHADKLAKGETPYIKAEGVVKARVWHEGYAEATLVQREQTVTGRVQRHYSLVLGTYIWSWKPAIRFKTYTSEERVYQPGMGAWRIPLVLTVTRIKETVETQIPIPEAQALAQAEAAAWEQVHGKLRVGTQLSVPGQTEVETIIVDGIPVVRVHVTQEVLEDIRQFRPLETASGPGVYRPVLGPPPKVQPVPGP